MRALRSACLALLCIVLALSGAVFTGAYSLLHSVSPRMFMAVVDAAGGLDTVVDQVLDYVVPAYSQDSEMQAALFKSGRSALTPGLVSDWVADAISGVKRFIHSGGWDTAMLVNLRPLKASFLAEFRKNLPSAFDDMEKRMERVPDRPSLAQWIALYPLQSSSRSYQMVSDIPLLAGMTGLVCLVLICLAPGWRAKGPTLVGACLIAAGLIILAGAAYAASGPLPRALQGIPPTLTDVIAGIAPALFFPISADPKVLAQAAADFALGHVRLGSTACLALGAALVLAPRRKWGISPRLMK